ncbi:rho-related BTB domain-containing protein 3-like [Acipenser oxyrinchus oxyrinchus]|uniref:Rho-related BTB domain-containing protein 3-like n=1 Tax=Acipenser oxyrinchus oxyrinchus TaxID=40147 RepID=A0AAD8LTJ5_ACIOX|nr:rho-related BTB domain-containing protein 3-like [Acipenser oxyrinchus oxyrinchus]
MRSVLTVFILHRSVRIVALGNEKDRLLEDGQHQSSLLWTYLGRSAGVHDRRDNVSLSSAPHTTFPAFTEYQAYVFGDVRVVVHDCPSWDLFDNDWYSSRNVVGQADIIVIKYSVNDKPAFQEVKENYTPMIKRLLNQCTVPIIIAAVGARQNDEGPPCTCPLCTSDKGGCVPTCEGLQLSKELGATYLELHTLNDFYAGKYFGGVLEYFIVQCLNQKSSEKNKKKKSRKPNGPNPPRLEQPAKLPTVKAEDSSYSCDFLRLLGRSQCADVTFCSEGLGGELARAHKVVLCSTSPVFLLLLGVEAGAAGEGSCSPSAVKAALNLFSVSDSSTGFPTDPTTRGRHPGDPPTRVFVKDPLLCLCLSETLQFVYSGASRWNELEKSIRKRLKSVQEIEELLSKVRFLLGYEKGSTEQAPLRHSTCNSTPIGHLFNSPVLTDVIFKVQGVLMPAHRAVLAARCEVMAAMFNGNYAEANSCVVPIHSVSKDTFLSFLEYLYTDTCCPASVSQATALLVCAEMYQVPRLQHICEVCIITHLQCMPSRELASTNLSVVNLLRKAKFHNAVQLSAWLLHFIASNYLIFSQKPDFLDLAEDERDFVEKHRWPSSRYVQQLAEFRQHVPVRRLRCTVM